MEYIQEKSERVFESKNQLSIMILIKIFLHGKPNWYLPIEGKTTIKSSIIREYANKLRDHLYNISYVVESLQNMGWYVLKTYGTMYYLEYCKFDISLDEARRELEDIGIVNNVILEELDFENAY